MLRQASTALVSFSGLLRSLRVCSTRLPVTAVAQSPSRGRPMEAFCSRMGQAVGSTLIGQEFTAPQYFWDACLPRLRMRTTPRRLPAPTWGPRTQRCLTRVSARIAAATALLIRATRPPVPVDLVTSSGAAGWIRISAWLLRDIRCRGLPKPGAWTKPA